MPAPFAHRFHNLGDASHFLRAFRQKDIFRITARTRTVTGRGDNCFRNYDQARADHQPFVNRAFDRSIRKTRSFRSQIPQESESGQQGIARMIHRLDGSIRDWFFQHLIIPERLIVRVKENMRMEVHEPRQQRHIGQLDSACIGRRGDLT